MWFDLRKSEPVGSPLGSFFKVFNNVFDRSTGTYISVTKIATRKITMSLVFIGFTLVAAGWLGVKVPVGFIPEEDQGYLYINAQLPVASSLQRTNDLSYKVEKIVAQIPEIEMTTTVAGFSLLSSSNSTNSTFFFVTLKDWGERKLTAKQITQKLNYLFATQITEAKIFAFGPPAIPGLGNGSGFSIMIQDKGGNTPDYLANYTNEFIKAANARPEIGMATTFEAGVPQRFIDINKDKILKLGVNLNDVYTTFAAFLGGSYVNDFNRFGRLYRAYVQAEPEYRNDEKKLDFSMSNQKWL